MRPTPRETTIRSQQPAIWFISHSSALVVINQRILFIIEGFIHHAPALRWNSSVKSIPRGIFFCYSKIKTGIQAANHGESSRGIELWTPEFHLWPTLRTYNWKRGLKNLKDELITHSLKKMADAWLITRKTQAGIRTLGQCTIRTRKHSN